MVHTSIDALQSGAVVIWVTIPLVSRCENSIESLIRETHRLAQYPEVEHIQP